jgi:hypothetical protein
MAWQRGGIETRQPRLYSVRLWLLRLGPYHLTQALEQADDWMWIADHTLQLGNCKCLIIGKFKHVAGKRGDHGLTGMVLSIGAHVGKQTLATVETALAETPTHHVWNWCHTHLGRTVQSVRKRIRQALRKEQRQLTLLLKTG